MYLRHSKQSIFLFRLDSIHTFKNSEYVDSYTLNKTKYFLLSLLEIFKIWMSQGGLCRDSFARVVLEHSI